MTDLKQQIESAVAFGEVLTKAFMRRELVDKMVSGGLNALSRNELDGLHALDRVLAGIDLLYVIEEREQRLQPLLSALAECAVALENVPLALGHYEAAERHPQFATELDLEISKFVKQSRQALDGLKKVLGEK